jgi:hypothetical protein
MEERLASAKPAWDSPGAQRCGLPHIESPKKANRRITARRSLWTRGRHVIDPTPAE